MRKIAVSGGFDPVHIGHLQMFEEAKAMGDYLVVILNGDAWLERKKGYAFMPALQRASIIGAMACVDEVYIHEAEEDDVCGALEKLRPDVFANGGDRKLDNVPEVAVCHELGIEMAFNVGGVKVESSTELIMRAMDRVMNLSLGRVEKRPWGEFELYAHGRNFWVKRITLKPGSRTSLQRHKYRGELWMCVEGEVTAQVGRESWNMRDFRISRFGKGVVHRLSSAIGGTIIEIGYGVCAEDDIERIEDDYGRA